METAEHIKETEQHPLQPFLPCDAKMLMLGSFPPSRQRWCMEFFYPNFINDMWRIFGIVFFNDKDHFVDKENKSFDKDRIVNFLTNKGIALYDTASAVIRTRNTASDKDLEIITQTDIKSLIDRIPKCKSIVTTGQKATDILVEQFNSTSPKVGSSTKLRIDNRQLTLFRMPSSSRAYPMNIYKKAESYAEMFKQAGLLTAKDEDTETIQTK
ncbi:MAG: uracil-DNA glycosylase family protein [Paraprevotella sp.]|nr:uracil-DNA glycosylase family protein [Paraprevotella sp.]